MSTIQSYIKRFREAPPSSSDERKSSNRDDFWWIERQIVNNFDSANGTQIVVPKVPHQTHVLGKAKEFYGYETQVGNENVSETISPEVLTHTLETNASQIYGHEKNIDTLDMKADDLLQKCDHILRSYDGKFGSFVQKENSIIPVDFKTVPVLGKEGTSWEYEADFSTQDIFKTTKDKDPIITIGISALGEDFSIPIGQQSADEAVVELENSEINEVQIRNSNESDDFFNLPSPTLSPCDEVLLLPQNIQKFDILPEIQNIVQAQLLISIDDELYNSLEGQKDENKATTSDSFYLSSSFESVDWTQSMNNFSNTIEVSEKVAEPNPTVKCDGELLPFVQSENIDGLESVSDKISDKESINFVTNSSAESMNHFERNENILKLNPHDITKINGADENTLPSLVSSDYSVTSFESVTKFQNVLIHELVKDNSSYHLSNEQHCNKLYKGTLELEDIALQEKSREVSNESLRTGTKFLILPFFKSVYLMPLSF